MEKIKTEVIATPTEAPVAAEPKKPEKPPEPKELVEPVSSTQRPSKSWLYAALALLGLAAVLVAAQVPRWIREARERRIHTAVNTVTPESLLARCGQPAADVTKDLYPIIRRTITYKPQGEGRTPLVLEFSRTAEEKSDWVFLSMSDENGTKYSTAEEQTAALPCLDSKN
jgi:hypothetical protein